MIFQLIKRLFCKHTYKSENRVSSQYNDISYDSTYYFRCSKCGSVKVIHTYGADGIG